MNTFDFISLLRMIYGRKKLDLDKIQKMGLLAVKIGQVHALRIDFLDAEKCFELTKLYRSTTPISKEEVLRHIDIKKFKKVNLEPLASASVGQVHLAELKTGEKVVIKIIKQDFKKQFEKDVKSIKRLMLFAIFFYPKLKKVFDPIGIIEHIEEYTLNELDLRKEIKGHETLKRIYEKNNKKYDLSKLKFPKIYKELSGENVMVSEYLPGKTFDELLTNKEMNYDQLLELFQIQGFYIFSIGIFHADLHPGNIILDNGKINFIDTGAIGEVKNKIRRGLFYFFEALSSYDYENCAYWLNEMADKQIHGENFDKFKKQFIDLYKDFSNSTVSEVSLTKKMMQTIKLGVNNGMQFEKGMFSIIKSLMFLDGMVIRCNPDAKLLKDMKKYIVDLKRNI